jgi:hypothetical protein
MRVRKGWFSQLPWLDLRTRGPLPYATREDGGGFLSYVCPWLCIPIMGEQGLYDAIIVLGWDDRLHLRVSMYAYAYALIRRVI